MNGAQSLPSPCVSNTPNAGLCIVGMVPVRACGKYSNSPSHSVQCGICADVFVGGTVDVATELVLFNLTNVSKPTLTQDALAAVAAGQTDFSGTGFWHQPCGFDVTPLPQLIPAWNTSKCERGDDASLCFCHIDSRGECRPAGWAAVPGGLNSSTATTSQEAVTIQPQGPGSPPITAIRTTYTSQDCTRACNNRQCKMTVISTCPDPTRWYSHDPTKQWDLIYLRNDGHSPPEAALCPQDVPEPCGYCLGFYHSSYCDYLPCGPRTSAGAPVCSGHGACAGSRCLCEPGYTGAYCQQDATCAAAAGAQCSPFADCSWRLQPSPSPSATAGNASATCSCMAGYQGDGASCHPAVQRLIDLGGQAAAQRLAEWNAMVAGSALAAIAIAAMAVYVALHYCRRKRKSVVGVGRYVTVGAPITITGSSNFDPAG